MSSEPLNGTINVAFIGAGDRSVGHLTALSQIPDVRIVGLADLDTDRAQNAQARTNERRPPGSTPVDAPVFSDYRRMLDQVAPDAVYLCLPPYVHGEIDHAVIDYGKPIFFEKPVAVDMSVANEIADHVRSSGIINAVGYQKRYSAAVRRAKEVLEGVPIGMVISIRLSGLPEKAWWRVQERSGGMLVEQHTHAVDLMRFLCGEVTTIYAVGSNQLSQNVPDMNIFDVNACTLRFANGAPGIIGNSCAAPAGAAIFPPHLVHVVAADAVLSVNSDKTVIHRSGREPEEIRPDGRDDLLMNRAFIEAVRNGTQGGILSDYADATRTLAITLGCQTAAESGQPVGL